MSNDTDRLADAGRASSSATSGRSSPIPTTRSSSAPSSAPPTPYTVAWVPALNGQNTQPGELWPQMEHSCGAAGGASIPRRRDSRPTGASAIRACASPSSSSAFPKSHLGSVCDASYTSAWAASSATSPRRSGTVIERHGRVSRAIFDASDRARRSVYRLWLDETSPSRTREAPAKKRRSRGRKRNDTGEVARAPAPAPAFDDLTEAFFAAAPPDDAAPTVAPECFDDLVAVGPAPHATRSRPCGAPSPPRARRWGACSRPRPLSERRASRTRGTRRA